MTEETPSAPSVSLAKLFTVFLNVGATSFGGGVVAYLREHLVVRQKWLDENHFLAALEVGQTVPGLTSTNISVIVGSRLRGVPGAIVSVLGMTIPGTISVFILGLLYAQFRTNPEVSAMLHGVGAAAVGLILAVTLQVGSSALKRSQDIAILIVAFLLVGVWHVSLLPVLVVLAPISIRLNRPDQNAVADYHARQASYYAQLATHHGGAAAGGDGAREGTTNKS